MPLAEKIQTNIVYISLHVQHNAPLTVYGIIITTMWRNYADSCTEFGKFPHET